MEYEIETISSIYPFISHFINSDLNDAKIMYTVEEKKNLEKKKIVKRMIRFKGQTFINSFSKFLSIFGFSKKVKINGVIYEKVPYELFYDENALVAYVNGMEFIGLSSKTISNYLLSVMKMYDFMISNDKTNYRKLEIFQDRMNNISSKYKIKYGRIEKDDEIKLINEFKMITPSENATLIFRFMIYFSEYFKLKEEEKNEKLMDFQKKLFTFLVCVGGGYRIEVFMHMEQNDFEINETEKTLSFTQHKEKRSRQGQHGVLPFFCATLLNYWLDKINIFKNERNDSNETLSLWVNKKGFPWNLKMFNNYFQETIDYFLPKMELTGYSYRRFVVTNFLKKNYDKKNNDMDYFIFIDKVSRFLNTSRAMMERNYNLSQLTDESNNISILLNESINTPMHQLELFFNNIDNNNKYPNIRKKKLQKLYFKFIKKKF